MAFPLIANASILMPDRPLADRFRAAADAGFADVELWWPFETATPSAAEVRALTDGLRSAGVGLRGLNLYAGDMPAGERGVLSHAERTEQFRESIAVVASIAEETGCAAFNALIGAAAPGEDPAERDRTTTANLAFAAEALGDLGGTLLVEPMSGVAGYPVLTADDAVALIDRVAAGTGHRNLALLFDTFHLTNNGDDLLDVIARHSGRIGHVQLADAPGRGEPGSGAVGFAAVLDALAAAGYSGRVAAEYAPSTTFERSLDWVAGLPQLRPLG